MSEDFSQVFEKKKMFFILLKFSCFFFCFLPILNYFYPLTKQKDVAYLQIMLK